MSIRILIVDDHAYMRRALVDLLADFPDIQVVGECSDGGQVVSAVALTQADVVLMDLQMPHVDGLQATRELSAAHPRVRVVVLTGGLTPASVREANGLGVACYLLKEGDPRELPDQIRVVASGGSAWNPVAAALVGHDARQPDPSPSLGLFRTHVEETPRRLHDFS